MTRIFFIVSLLLLHWGGASAQDGTTRPDAFPSKTTPEADDAIYSQEDGGNPVKILFSDARKYFGAQVVSQASAPSASGNSESVRNKLIQVTSDNSIWFVDGAGIGIRLYNPAAASGGNVYVLDAMSDTTTISTPLEGDIAYVDSTLVAFRSTAAWLVFEGGGGSSASLTYVDSLHTAQQADINERIDSIEAGANITLSGTGTAADPLIISAAGGGAGDVDSLVSLVFATDTLTATLASGQQLKAYIPATPTDSLYIQTVAGDSAQAVLVLANAYTDAEVLIINDSLAAHRTDIDNNFAASIAYADTLQRVFEIATVADTSTITSPREGDQAITTTACATRLVYTGTAWNVLTGVVNTELNVLSSSFVGSELNVYAEQSFSITATGVDSVVLESFKLNNSELLAERYRYISGGSCSYTALDGLIDATAATTVAFADSSSCVDANLINIDFTVVGFDSIEYVVNTDGVLDTTKLFTTFFDRDTFELVLSSASVSQVESIADNNEEITVTRQDSVLTYLVPSNAASKSSTTTFTFCNNETSILPTNFNTASNTITLTVPSLTEQGIAGRVPVYDQVDVMKPSVVEVTDTTINLPRKVKISSSTNSQTPIAEPGIIYYNDPDDEFRWSDGIDEFELSPVLKQVNSDAHNIYGQDPIFNFLMGNSGIDIGQINFIRSGDESPRTQIQSRDAQITVSSGDFNGTGAKLVAYPSASGMYLGNKGLAGSAGSTSAYLSSDGTGASFRGVLRANTNSFIFHRNYNFFARNLRVGGDNANTIPDYMLHIDGTDAMKHAVGTTSEQPTAILGLMRANSDTDKYEVGFDDGSWENLATESYVDNLEKSQASFLALSPTTTLTQSSTFSHVTGFFGSNLTDFSATSDSTLTYNGASGKSFLLVWNANLEIATTSNTTFNVDIAPYSNGTTIENGRARIQVDLDSETRMISLSKSLIIPSLSNGTVISLRNTATVDANTNYTLRNHNVYITEL